MSLFVTRPIRISSIAITVCLLFGWGTITRAQKPAETPKQDDSVVRINTELVQSPVMVFDKQGHFVDALQREQFELRIDGRPQAISFFERVTAGSANEERKYQAARKGSLTTAEPKSSGTTYGRTVFFFIDDLHLSSDSVNRLRKALLDFIENSMGQNDRAIVTTASGQLGFLQQLTDNKDVLRIAVERLKYRQFFNPDENRPPMSPYQAMAIEANDSRVISSFVEMLIRDGGLSMQQQMPDMPGNKNQAATKQMFSETVRRQAELSIRSRARNTLTQYSAVSAASLKALEYLMASTTQLPGSKLIVLFSDGFLMNSQIAGEQQKLHDITSAAMRAGAIIYSIQASGLGTAAPDSRAPVRFGPDMSPPGQSGLGEDTATQAPLYTLAVDTGGRALFNSNSMEGGIKQAVDETSEYYLIAWRPETAEQRSDTFRQIQITIKNHPELTVRVQKGYVSPAKSSATDAAVRPLPNDSQQANKPQAAEEKIREVLSAPYPVADLPTSVSVSFLDAPNEGEQIMVASEISTEAVGQPGPIDLVGIVLNDEGKSVWTFREKLPRDSAAAKSVSQITQIKIKPGLYQVRVAARDQMSGVTGSAAQWILVPDLSARRIALSSLLIGDRAPESAGTKSTSEQRVPLSISHRFTRDSRLRFMTYIYNAAPGQGKTAPEVTIQMRLMRDDKAVFTGPLVKVGTEGLDDLARLPYAAELLLRTLPSGRYALLVTATDAVTKASAMQRVKFSIE
jgi:VWFA-related protein